MGQEQSSAQTTPISHHVSPPDSGVVLVQGSGSAVGTSSTSTLSSRCDELLQKSSQLALPQPLLPSSSVDDNITSALQGTKMIHELRTLLDGFSTTYTLTNILHGLSSSSPAPPSSSTPSSTSSTTVHGRRMDELIRECTGGEAMDEFVARQVQLIERIVKLNGTALRIKTDVDANREQARQIVKVVEQLERLSLTLADIHDQLEQVVANSNTVGAAHFADDDQMSSFSNYLRHNPPEN